jgi:hypothetical protein
VTAVHAELGVNVPHMGGHGVHRQEELAGDFRCGEVSRQVAQDADLAVGERVFGVLRPGSLGLGRGRRREQTEDPGDERGMGGVVAALSLQHSRGGVQEERQHHAVGFGELQGAFEGALGGTGIALGFPGDGLEQESVHQRGIGVRQGSEGAKDGHERLRRGARVILGEPQCREDGTHLRGVPLTRVEPGNGDFDALGFTQPEQGVQQAGLRPLRQRMRCREPLGQPFGGAEGGQCLVPAAAGELEHPAGRVQQYPGRRLGPGLQGALGVVKPRFCLRELSLPDQRVTVSRAGDRGDWFLAPAVRPGQLDRLCAHLSRDREGPLPRDRRQVCQALEFERGLPDLAGKREALLQVPLRAWQLPRAQLADAEADEGQRVQVIAGPERPVRVLGEGEQPWHFLRDGWQVAVSPGV